MHPTYFAAIDTNMLVSGLYVPEGSPGRVIAAVMGGLLVPVFDERILAEHAKVLARPKFRALFSLEAVDAVLADWRRFGIDAGALVEPYPGPLPDESDRPFAEVALAAGVPLVTGNARDFPPELGLEVVTAAEMARRLGV